MIHTEIKLDELMIKSELEIELKQIIYMALKSLKTKHALIIRLKYWQKLPHKKIAAIVKTSPNCVGVTLKTIRGKIRKELQKNIDKWRGEVQWHETH